MYINIFNENKNSGKKCHRNSVQKITNTEEKNPYIAQKLKSQLNAVVSLDITEETYNLKSGTAKTVYHKLASKISSKICLCILLISEHR